MYAVHMESMDRPELGPLSDRRWSGMAVEDLFRLLKLADDQEGLDISDDEIIQGHHRSINWERLLQAAYALGLSDADEGNDRCSSYQIDLDRAEAWKHAEDPS